MGRRVSSYGDDLAKTVAVCQLWGDWMHDQLNLGFPSMTPIARAMMFGQYAASGAPDRSPKPIPEPSEDVLLVNQCWSEISAKPIRDALFYEFTLSHLVQRGRADRAKMTLGSFQQRVRAGLWYIKGRLDL